MESLAWETDVDWDHPAGTANGFKNHYTISIETAVYTFGGYLYHDGTQITKFENWRWSDVGSLFQGRSNILAVNFASEDEFFLIGGYPGSPQTELWDPSIGSSTRPTGTPLDHRLIWSSDLRFWLPVDPNFCASS